MAFLFSPFLRLKFEKKEKRLKAMMAVAANGCQMTEIVVPGCPSVQNVQSAHKSESIFVSWLQWTLKGWIGTETTTTEAVVQYMNLHIGRKLTVFSSRSGQDRAGYKYEPMEAISSGVFMPAEPFTFSFSLALIWPKINEAVGWVRIATTSKSGGDL